MNIPPGPSGPRSSTMRPRHFEGCKILTRSPSLNASVLTFFAIGHLRASNGTPLSCPVQLLDLPAHDDQPGPAAHFPIVERAVAAFRFEPGGVDGPFDV